MFPSFVSVTAPLRSLKLFKLNVLDNYFRYRGQEHFYTSSGGMLSEESYTLRCKLSGACELESPVFPDTSKSVYNMQDAAEKYSVYRAEKSFLRLQGCVCITERRSTRSIARKIP